MSLAPRVVIVYRHTELQELRARHATRGQAQFFLAQRGRTIEEVEVGQAAQTAAVRAVTAAIPVDWRRGSVERADVPRFLFEPDDVVVAVGQDGLVANVAKYLDGQPVIGINDDPRRNPGVLVQHAPAAAAALMRRGTGDWSRSATASRPTRCPRSADRPCGCAWRAAGSGSWRRRPGSVDAMTDVAGRRLRAQRLTGEPFATAEEAVGWLGAVQSQDYAGAKWALGLRTRGLTDADVDRLFDAGAILRTHVMRPTWHFVLPDDVRWLLELTASRVKARLAHADPQLGIDAALLARSHAAIGAALRDGRHLTRTELARALERSGIAAAGQRLGHLLMHAELDAVVVSGPRRGRQFTYALLDERAPGTRRLDRDAALAELTRRYFTSHGPAQLPDFTWWSGLTAADAKRGLALARTALAQEPIDGAPHWRAPDERRPHDPGAVVHLLPNFDEFLVAYRDRRAVLDPRLETSPLPNGSVLANVVLLDGRVVCGWRRRAGGREVVVEAGPLHGVDGAALARAAGELARFLGVPVSLVAAAPRSPGG